mmetsp:Transcript_97/g.137  ORF Transcript_97/g.137 Transcript_97/m.137 type:complete len:184 (+) Transcript_97:1-552(+)
MYDSWKQRREFFRSLRREQPLSVPSSAFNDQQVPEEEEEDSCSSSSSFDLEPSYREDDEEETSSSFSSRPDLQISQETEECDSIVTYDISSPSSLRKRKLHLSSPSSNDSDGEVSQKEHGEDRLVDNSSSMPSPSLFQSVKQIYQQMFKEDLTARAMLDSIQYLPSGSKRRRLYRELKAERSL